MNNLKKIFDRDTWDEIFESISKNRTRTIITTIGVFWGIFIYIALAGSAKGLENGFDEALMLDSEGFIAEGSGENFFLVKNGILYSPDLDSCLDGITRRTILALAEQLNITFTVKKLTLEDVLEAEESFFSGTAAEVVPINSIDGKLIGSGTRGPITEKLQSAYFDQVRGIRDANHLWHTYTK